MIKWSYQQINWRVKTCSPVLYPRKGRLNNHMSLITLLYSSFSQSSYPSRSLFWKKFCWNWNLLLDVKLNWKIFFSSKLSDGCCQRLNEDLNYLKEQLIESSREVEDRIILVKKNLRSEERKQFSPRETTSWSTVEEALKSFDEKFDRFKDQQEEKRKIEENLSEQLDFFEKKLQKIQEDRIDFDQTIVERIRSIEVRRQRKSFTFLEKKFFLEKKKRFEAKRRIFTSFFQRISIDDDRTSNKPDFFIHRIGETTSSSLSFFFFVVALRSIFARTRKSSAEWNERRSSVCFSSTNFFAINSKQNGFSTIISTNWRALRVWSIRFSTKQIRVRRKSENKSISTKKIYRFWKVNAKSWIRFSRNSIDRRDEDSPRNIFNWKNVRNKSKINLSIEWKLSRWSNNAPKIIEKVSTNLINDSKRFETISTKTTTI